MKKLLAFALRIMGLRLAVILLSLAQTTIWAAELGMAEFGIAQAFISTQMLGGLLGRFGADNVLVRQFRTDPDFAARFPAYLSASLLLSTGVGGASVLFLHGVILDRPLTTGAVLVFLALIVGFNLMQILSQIAIAQKRQVLVTVLNGVLPLAVSVGLFLLSRWTPLADMISLSRHLQAVAYLALGYLLASAALALALRGFLVECRARRGELPGRLRLLLGQEQWHFLGYQSMGLARGHGITLAVAALFGPATAGVFALALRFGNLLTYLNEPARMYALPRIAGRSKEDVWALYMRMLGMNAGLGIAGLVLLCGLYAFVKLPFSTDPPFPLFTLIILGGATVNLLVGPVGAILAQSGNEKHNLHANTLGLGLAGICLLLAWSLQAPLWAVLAVALSNIAINLSNAFSLRLVMRAPDGLK